MNTHFLKLTLLLLTLSTLFSCELEDNLISGEQGYTIGKGERDFPTNDIGFGYLPYSIQTTEFNYVTKWRITWAYPIEDAWNAGMEAFKNYPTHLSFDNSVIYGSTLDVPENVNWHLHFNLAFHGFFSGSEQPHGYFLNFKTAEGYNNAELDNFAANDSESFETIYENDPNEPTGSYSIPSINPAGYDSSDTYTFVFTEPGKSPRYGAIKYMGMNPATGGKIMEVYLQKISNVIKIPKIELKNK